MCDSGSSDADETNHISKEHVELTLGTAKSKNERKIADVDDALALANSRTPKYRKNVKTSHIPPANIPSNTSNFSNMRINIPKPELKSSAQSKVYRSTVAMQSHELSKNQSNRPVVLARPSIPHISRSASQIDFTELHPPPIHRKPKMLSHNSFSTDHVNQISGNEMNHLKYQPQIMDKISRPLPRIPLVTPQSLQPIPQHHQVIDVVPKPLNRQQQQHQQPQLDWDIPDQTLGIPLINPIPILDLQYISPSNDSMHNNYQYHPTVLLPSHMQPSSSSTLYHSKPVMPLIKSKSMYNIPTNTPHIIHHPLVSGNIPPKYHSPDNYVTLKKHLTKGCPPPLPIPPKPKHRYNGANASSILSTTTQQNISPKRETGEKNKVKFSDTVTVAVVPVRDCF